MVYITALDGKIRKMVGDINIKSKSEGCFTSPRAIAVDPCGNFIVGEYERMQAFSSEGLFLSG